MSLTGGDVAVEHTPVLQCSFVPAAHSVSFLGEVGLVSFLQDALRELRRPLKYKSSMRIVLMKMMKMKKRVVPRPPALSWLLLERH